MFRALYDLQPNNRTWLIVYEAELKSVTSIRRLRIQNTLSQGLMTPCFDKYKFILGITYVSEEVKFQV